MPKLKTHRGAAKRFKKTGHGQDRPRLRLQAPHPDEQDDEVEAADARHARGRRAGRAEAEAGCCRISSGSR